MKAYLIANPASGSYNETKIQEIIGEINRGGVECSPLLTRSAGDATRLAAEHCDKCDIIIACGGDGTINEVVNGLPAGSTLAVIPMGSANVLAKEIGVLNARLAIEAIIKGKRRPFSLGSIENQGRRRIFFLMAGIGADGEAVEKLQLKEKREVGNLAYGFSAFRNMIRWDASMSEAIIDGQPVLFHTMIICNASRYGGHFKIAHQASLFNKEFQIIYTPSPSRLGLIMLYLRLLFSLRQKHYRLGSAVRIHGGKSIQIDGDFIGYAPATISILPDHLNIVCP